VGDKTVSSAGCGYRTPVRLKIRSAKKGTARDRTRGFLTPSRISVAMTCVGLARRAQELAIEYAGKRETFGKRLVQRKPFAL